MSRHLMAFAPFFGVALLASAATVGVQELTQTFVVNLESPHPVTGELTLAGPTPHSETDSRLDVVVAPASRAQTGLWTEAGVLVTDGFTTVVLSLHGQLRGSTGSGGVIAVVLVPEEENVLGALSEGEVHLALETESEPVNDRALYFSGASARLAVGFPSYRIFLYNTTERSAQVNVFAYLGQ